MGEKNSRQVSATSAAVAVYLLLRVKRVVWCRKDARDGQRGDEQRMTDNPTDGDAEVEPQNCIF